MIKDHLIKSWLIAFFLSFVLQTGHAQEVLFDTLLLEFDELGVEQGLSTGLVRYMIQDHQGYLWISTRKGLDRYNGYEIKAYQNIPGDSLSMPLEVEAYIVPAFADPTDNIWLFSREKKGFILDRITESFIPVNIPLWHSSFIDEQNRIWFYVEDEGWHLLPFEDLPDDPSDLRNAAHNKWSTGIQDYYPGLEGAPAEWMARCNNTLWWTSKDSLYAYVLDETSKKASLILKEPFVPQNLWDRNPLIADKIKGYIYLFYENGYRQYEATTGALLSQNQFPIPLPEFEIHLCDAKGRIWIYSSEYSLLLLDPQEERLSVIRERNRADERLYSSFHATEDKNNNIWLATNGYGLYKYSSIKGRFAYYGDNHYGPSTGIYGFTDQNEVLINQPGGITAIDDKNNARTFFNGNQFFDYSFSIYEVLNTPNREVWIRANLSPVPDQVKNRLLTIKLNEEGSLAVIDSSSIASSLVFEEGDSLWRIIFPPHSNAARNINSFRLQRIHESLNGDPVEYLFNSEISGYFNLQMALQATDRAIWMAFDDSGLVKFDPQSKAWQHYFNEPGNSNSLASNRVMSLLEDPEYPDSILWIGTASGLDQLDIKNNRFKHFNKRQHGFPDDMIYGVLADDHQNLWLSSNQGLFLFDPVTLNIRTFTREDGIQHNEFNRTAAKRGPSGWLYFGGVGGLTYFNPEEFYGDSLTSQVVIDGVRINNKKEVFQRIKNYSGDDFILESPMNTVQEITLNHHQKMISFEFAVLDLTNPKSNRFRYQLKGFDDNWIDLGTKNEVTFTNLDAGTYTLNVQGANRNDVWSKTPASIILKILPPWWESWWFRIFVSALIVTGIISFLQYRNRQELKLLNIRNRISENLHDEIGSTLSSIALFGTVAQKQINGREPEVSKMLDRINDNTTQMMESMNDIVWAIKSDNDKLEHVINRMRAYTSELMEATDWHIKFNYDEALQDTELSMIHRRNIYMVFKEAVNNAFKYSGGENLHIQFQIKGKKLELKIIDDGKGFVLEEVAKQNSLGGNGLKNMRRRADELNGTLDISTGPGQGTSIIYICSI